MEIEFRGIRKNISYTKLIENVTLVCLETEKLDNKNVEMNVILTTPEEIRKINKKYRGIDKETDVLSFPMFEKKEIKKIRENGSITPEVLGDIIISIEQVKKQADEYGHGFNRELAYMIVHGFYHCLGYDHMTEKDKSQMRKKEEAVLSKVGLEREQ
ncbi:MAG: rRNA maturation RNase YbeY [Clostridia bacterium]|nr:rRNA maturation RNase YbeY [Clostridia bacterium]